LPRKEGDFEPVDKVYDALDKVDLTSEYHALQGEREEKGRTLLMDLASRPPRTMEEMRAEAERLSKFFSQDPETGGLAN
jgi:hypothetical protein